MTRILDIVRFVYTRIQDWKLIQMYGTLGNVWEAGGLVAVCHLFINLLVQQ